MDIQAPGRAGGGPVPGGALFTGRLPEAHAFRDALRQFRRLLDDVDVAAEGRHNILAFSGVGGVGKTALSARLQGWADRKLPLVNGWGPPPDTPVRATVRLDLHDSAGRIDVLDLLLSLRRGVAEIQRNWGTFDLALAAYWSARFPGDPQPFLGASDVGEAVAETASNALQDLGVFATGAGLGIRAAHYAVKEIQRRRILGTYTDRFPGFADFLKNCADLPSRTEPCMDFACEIAGLLAWELAQVDPSPLMVVFIDAAERLFLDPRRGAEHYLNRLIWNLPNVLFVVSGRDPLDWWNGQRLDLPHRGPTAWPRMASDGDTDTCQIRVGNLSVPDRRTVLEAARDQQNLLLSDSLIDEVGEASGGLPQYLGLACQVAQSVRDQGGDEVTIEQVTGSVDTLVLQVLSDIPPEEQRALRAASLFRAFDIALVCAAGDVDRGSVERAVRRPMVDDNVGGELPYRVHDEIRRAIRQANAGVPGGWASEDWLAAASRALEEARRRHIVAQAGDDLPGLLDAIALAINIVCEWPVLPGASASANYGDWLAQAIVYGPSISTLRPLIPPRSETLYGQIILAFIAGKSPEVDSAQRLGLLRFSFESNHPLALPAGRHLAYELRNQSCWADALLVVDELIERKRSALHLRQRPITLALARRFREAVAELDPWDGGNVLRAIDFGHGKPERFFEEISTKVASLDRQRRLREHLEDLGDLELRRALFLKESDSVAEVQERAEAVGHNTALRSCLAATVLRGSRPRSEIELTLGRLRILEERRNGFIGFRFALAASADALVCGDAAGLARLAEEIAARPTARSRSWIPVEFLLAYAGHDLPEADTQWLEPVNVVQERWFEHFRAYLDSRGA